MKALIEKANQYCPKGYICFFIMIIVALYYNTTGTKYPDNHLSHYIGDSVWKISGVIMNQPEFQQKKTQLLIRVNQLIQKGIHYDVYGILRLSVWGNQSHLKKGMTIRFQSTINNFKSFRNPGGFDYKHYMNFQKKIDAYAYTPHHKIEVINPSSDLPWIERFRDKISQEISELIHSRSSDISSGFLHAIVLGNKTHLNNTIRHYFESTGTVHLLAISGLHMGMIAMVTFLWFRWLFRRSELLCLYGWSDICATIPSFIMLTSYFIISGMSPSSQRAYIMIVVFLLTQIVYREQQSLNTLCIAGTLILAWDIRSLFSISFQMSFSAVFFILLGFSKLQQYSHFVHRHFLFRHFINMFFCSLFAIIATSPLALHYFYQTSFMGIITNFMAVPFVGFCILPITLISIFTAVIWQPLAQHLMSISSSFSDIFIDCLRWISQYSDPFVLYGHLTILEIVCWFAIFLLCMTGIRSSFKYVWIIVIMTIAMDSLYWSYQRFFQETVRVSILDVGIGNSAVVELPGGRCIMIDGGGLSNAFDIGKYVVAPYLWQHKINTVDSIFLTHPDRDHLQGLLFVAEHFNVKNVWSNGDQKKSSVYQQFISIIKKKHIHHESLYARNEIKINNVTFRIFNPPFSSNPYFNDTNNNSLVIQLIYHDIFFLFPGDIEYEAEDLLVQNYCEELKSDLLLCPHHGSRTSSTQEFINCVQPDWVFVSVGEHYKKSLPNTQVLNRYGRSGCKIKRTDKDGAIIVRLGESIIIE